MATARELVTDLAESMGLDGLSFDENGMTGIQFDNLAVNIHADQETDEITLFLNIGDIPHSSDAKLRAYAYLLKTNNFARHTGGGVFGIDEEERSAYFSHRFSAESLTVARLEKIVEAFLNLADSFVTGFREAADQAAGGDRSSVPATGMRV